MQSRFERVDLVGNLLVAGNLLLAHPVAGNLLLAHQVAGNLLLAHQVAGNLLLAHQVAGNLVVVAFLVRMPALLPPVCRLPNLCITSAPVSCVEGTLQAGAALQVEAAEGRLLVQGLEQLAQGHRQSCCRQSCRRPP